MEILFKEWYDDYAPTKLQKDGVLASKSKIQYLLDEGIIDGFVNNPILKDSHGNDHYAVSRMAATFEDVEYYLRDCKRRGFQIYLLMLQQESYDMLGIHDYWLLRTIIPGLWKAVDNSQNS